MLTGCSTFIGLSHDGCLFRASPARVCGPVCVLCAMSLFVAATPIRRLQNPSQY